MDVYIHVETRRAEHLPDWLDTVPPPLPLYPEWEVQQEAPEVLPVEQQPYPRSCKKEETIARRQREAYEKATRARDEWRASLPEQYAAAIERREELIEEMRSSTALSPLAGGEVACVALLVADDEDTEIIRGETERQTLGRLAVTVSKLRREGQVRFVSWNGFGFAFRFLSMRAAYHAVRADHPGVRRALTDLAKMFAHSVAWKAPKHLAEAREAFRFGERRGKTSLYEGAAYLGYQVAPWWHDLDPSSGLDPADQDIRAIESAHMIRHVWTTGRDFGWLA